MYDEIEELKEQLATFEEPKDRKKKNKKRSESTKSVQSIIDVPDNLLEEEPEQVEHKPKRNKDNLKAIREKNKKKDLKNQMMKKNGLGLVQNQVQNLINY